MAYFHIKWIRVLWHFLRHELNLYRQIECRCLELRREVWIIGHAYRVFLGGNNVFVCAFKLVECFSQFIEIAAREIVMVWEAHYIYFGRSEEHTSELQSH